MTRMHAQTIATLVLIVAATLYLAWKWWPRSAAGGRTADKCGGCPGCPPAPKGERPGGGR
jgi:hypothetical protein